jgi:hypothetical protein
MSRKYDAVLKGENVCQGPYFNVPETIIHTLQQFAKLFVMLFRKRSALRATNWIGVMCREMVKIILGS